MNRMTLVTALVIFSSFSFLFFGLGCFFSPRMKTEFIRYGLNKQRKIVGALQFVGAVGLLFGHYQSIMLSTISALGLCLLMILGFGVRLKIKDSFLQSIPAFLYVIINGYLFMTFMGML